MRTIIALLVTSLVLVPAVVGQTTYSHTLPGGYDTVDGPYSIGAGTTTGTHQGSPFNLATGNSRWQFGYGWNQYFHQCPVLITQIAFRRSSDATLVGTVYPAVTVRMASLAPAYASHTAMSVTFANNLGPDQIIAYSGPVTIPAYTVGATPTVPAPWLVVIPLTTPFPYDPTKMRDLVIDIQVSAPAAAAGNFILDGTYPHAGVAQNGHTNNGASATSNWSNPDAGAIVRVTYSLGNPLSFDLIATTTGNGYGDLWYQYVNMPASAVEGYTLISLTPTSLFNVPFGRGPLFGIWPDSVTFSLILTPLAYGDLFHWNTPGLGLFPDVPIILPPATLSGFAGQVWELVGVALAPGGIVAGISPPRALTW